MPSASRNKSKKVADSVDVAVAVEPVPVPVPEPPVVATATTAPKKKKPAKTPEPEPEPEPEYTPTFPNIVILKQTEHNYIVKHNIDPRTKPVVVNTRRKDGDGDDGTQEDDNGTAAGAADTDADDLVTPNQIHKNQINKKRGRKPKAGLMSNTSSNLSDITEVPNIILHLKCHMSDLKTNDSISNYGYTPAIEEVESYNISNTSIQSSDIGNLNTDDGNHQEYNIDDDNDNDNHNNNDNNHYKNNNTCESASALSSCNAGLGIVGIGGIGGAAPTSIVSTSAPPANVISSSTLLTRNINIIQERNNKEIMKKINRLKYSFHNGESLQSKINHKSACFWDTCDFDTQMYYIPVMIVNDIFQVYGCFCSPECAVAFLLKEPIDTSTKFERLHLIQLLYGNPNGRGIKPAPNPYYLLDKYYGNLTIQEYRQLLKGPQLIHIVNKPLTHILPELYEDNNDFLVNSKVIPTNNLKLKKRYKTMVVQNSEA
jgi:hypothetical protein